MELILSRYILREGETPSFDRMSCRSLVYIKKIRDDCQHSSSGAISGAIPVLGNICNSTDLYSACDSSGKNIAFACSRDLAFLAARYLRRYPVSLH